MNKEIKISFLGKIKRPVIGNRFIDALFTILTIVLYPVILLFGLMAMIFAGLLSLWQWLTTKGDDLQNQKKVILETESESRQWSIFTSTNSIQIEKQVAGSLPWDSGDYLYLRSNPTISYLIGKWFGDWLFIEFGGVFLQRWNDTRQIDCDLVFIDFDTLKVTVLKKSIPTKQWTVEKLNSNEIEFTFTTSDSDLKFIVKLTEVNQNETK